MCKQAFIEEYKSGWGGGGGRYSLTFQQHLKFHKRMPTIKIWASQHRIFRPESDSHLSWIVALETAGTQPSGYCKFFLLNEMKRMHSAKKVIESGKGGGGEA
jgi:hypothetical protein